MSFCKGCGAAVQFVKSEKGNTMCLNAEPDPERGNVIISRDHGHELARVLNATHAITVRALGNEVYLSHHATCPDAARFTKSKTAAARR
jgi:hypothetical protein